MNLITTSKYKNRGIVLGCQVDYNFRYYNSNTNWKELSFRFSFFKNAYEIHIKIKRGPTLEYKK